MLLVSPHFCRSIGCTNAVNSEADFCNECVIPANLDQKIQMLGSDEDQQPSQQTLSHQIKDSNPKDVIGARKAKMSVIPAGVLLDLGNALTEGMAKYGRHNYRAVGVRASVYYDAAMGHLMDWWEGQDIDAESGLSHVTKAMASLTVLRDAMLQDMLHDDRPPRSKVFKADFSKMTGEILDRHADKNPRHYTIQDSLWKA